MSYAQESLADDVLSLANEFGVGGDAWVITHENADGDTETVGTAQPLYVRQRRLSRLERVLDQSAATLRAEWSAYWAEDIELGPETGDTITNADDATLAFRIGAVSTTDRPGVLIAELEKQPYT